LSKHLSCDKRKFGTRPEWAADGVFHLGEGGAHAGLIEVVRVGGFEGLQVLQQKKGKKKMDGTTAVIDNL